MREASLSRSREFGLSPRPLLGSEERWEAVASETRAVDEMNGVVRDVNRGAVGDYRILTILQRLERTGRERGEYRRRDYGGAP